MQHQSIAARAGRWSANHRKTAIFGWILFVVLAAFIGGNVGQKTISDADSANGESGRADRALEAGFPQLAAEQVLVQSDDATISDPVFRAGLADVVRRLESERNVTAIKTPLDPGGQGQLADGGHSALLTFRVRGDKEEAADKIGPVLDQVAAAQRDNPELRIEEIGDASAEKAFTEAIGDDFAKATKLSLPITLLILFVAFGALVAAGIPVLLALSGVIAAMGLTAIASHISPLDEAVAEVILLVGMAVGVDYSLFYMRRQREERANGHSNEEALEIAAATSGRSVLVSGLTVAIAMAGMYLSGDKTFSSFATGTILVVGVSMIASLTVLPATLSLLGDRVMKGRVPFLAKRRERSHGESRAWNAVLDRVLRRPVVAIVIAGGILVAMAVPALGLHTADTGINGLPQNLPATKTINRIEASFPGGPVPAQVVVESSDVHDPAIRDGIAQLKSRALASGEISQPVAVDYSANGKIAVVSLPLQGDGTDDRSDAALSLLRDDLVPATVGSVPGATAGVTGMTAESRDFTDSIRAHAPLVFAFVLSMAFMLLLVTFRSIVIPVKAIVLNLLSVGAAYGVLVVVFQHGVGESLLGFKSTGAVTTWLPMFLFVILFGLSMDYHVFILSRIREAYDRGMSTEDAVAHGIKSTASVVTSAAVVMVAVFGIFASLGALDFKMMGVGLASAILIDATLVRAVLLPATMKVLGDWNWYLPAWLGWLPRVRPEVEMELETAPA